MHKQFGCRLLQVSTPLSVCMRLGVLSVQLLDSHYILRFFFPPLLFSSSPHLHYPTHYLAPPYSLSPQSVNSGCNDLQWFSSNAR